MLEFPHGDAIPSGSAVALDCGIQWLRLPLPFGIDHINVWAVPDGVDASGWALVDTGAGTPESHATWERYDAGVLGQRPVLQLIVTHWHPDHSGAAGWLQQRHRCGFAMTRLEYEAACARSTAATTLSPAHRRFYAAAGWSEAQVAGFEARLARFRDAVGPMPGSFERLENGATRTIGGQQWTIVAGAGHSPEHACLVNDDLGVMIAGDQVLPRISSNVSVHPKDPQANPLADWFASLAALRARAGAGILVLPAHGGPFFGLHERIDQLVAGHEQGLARMAEHLATPSRVVDTHRVLFGREVGPEVYWLATGEALAHLNCLMARGQVQSELDRDGVAWYRRA